MIIDVHENPTKFMEFVEAKVEQYEDSISWDDKDITIAVSNIKNSNNTVYAINVFDEFDYDNMSGDYTHCETIQEYWDDKKERFCLKVSISKKDSNGYDIINGIETVEYIDGKGYAFDTGGSMVYATDVFDSLVLFADRG